MPLQSSVFIATSLDGYIARVDGALDWLDRANTRVPEGEDCGYNDFMASIDILVLGRKSFEKVLSFGAWPYQDKPVIVLSSKAVNIPAEIAGTVSYSSESPQALYGRLAKTAVKRLYIDGGITIQRFLSAGLIDDITITVIPIILGSGRPLFDNVKNDISLRLSASKIYDFGFVQLTYHVDKNG